MCKECGKEFSKWSGLTTHMKCVHSTDSAKNKFDCDVDGCKKTYHMKQTLMSHKRRVHCTNPSDLRPATNYVCDICGKIFKTNSSLTVNYIFSINVSLILNVFT